MVLQTQHLARCIETLERSLQMMNKVEPGSIEYEIFRNAVVKGFELVLELTGKLLRRALVVFTGNASLVDELTFKDVFRHSARHGLLDVDAVQRWFKYRDDRNMTAHEYGVDLAEETVRSLPDFVADARVLEAKLREKLGHAET